VVHEFERGQLIIFKSLFRTGECPFTIRAGQELVVIAIPASDFKAFLASDMVLAHDIERAISSREEAAARVLAQSFPGQFEVNGSADRVQYLREMFRV
jgi:CRP-like cAMP-binding protein